MRKDFRVCLVKASLLWSLAFLVLKGASSANEPKCEISCRLGDGPKDEETVDPDSFIPSHCSIKNGGNISRNMTWKEVNGNLTLKPGVQCLVLKTGNSEKSIYFASPLTVTRWGSPVFLNEKQMSRGVKCMFKGRPRPQITWYKDGSNLKTFNHTEEVEKLQGSGIFKVTTTLHVPGREEFAGIYRCFGNNSLSSGWSSSKEPMDGIELLFRCLGIYIKPSEPTVISANAFSNITLSCLVAKTVTELDDLLVTWNFKNQSDPLKTGGKYRIPALDPISSCKRAFKLEIINVTADDEGVYSCHQTCKDSGEDVCKSSAQLKLNVSLPLPTKYPTPTTRRYLEEGMQKEKLFVSYSSKDFSWVTENLISPLKKHSIPFSNHSIDLKSGKQNITNIVHNSRQVLIVLSNNYLASNFCREKLCMALQRRADTGDSSLIVVNIDNLKEKQLPCALTEKNLLKFEKHQKKPDWEEKLIKALQVSEETAIV